MNHKKVMQFLLINFFIILFINISGCSYKQSTPPDSIQPLDNTRTLSVKASLNTDPILASEKIEVTVKNDKVTLSGTVHSEESKQRAEKIALKTRGINKVINNLQLIKNNN